MRRPLVVLVCAALLLSACGSGLPTPDAPATRACQRFASLVHRIDAGKLKDRKGKKGKKVKRKVRRAVNAIVADAKASGDPDVVRAADGLSAQAGKGSVAVRQAAADMIRACADAGVSDSPTPAASASPS
jgi:hypothetical protein